MFLRFLALTLVSLLLMNCSSERSQKADSNDNGELASVSESQFQLLNWLEGTWHGTGGKSESFYETYKLVNDTTIRFQVFNDSTLTVTNYKGTITLSDNTVTYKSGPNIWKATLLEDKKVQFAPRERVKNSITWTKESSDEWRAVLRYPEVGGQALKLKYIKTRVSNP